MDLTSRMASVMHDSTPIQDTHVEHLLDAAPISSAPHTSPPGHPEGRALSRHCSGPTHKVWVVVSVHANHTLLWFVMGYGG